MACAHRPSWRAMVMTASASRASAAGEYWMTLDFFTNSSVESGEEKRAVPPVGSVWLGPAT